MAQNNLCNLQHTIHNVIIGSTNNVVANVAPSATVGIPLISQGASADPIFSTGVVAGGMTGDTSFTAYAVICGGTTSTGALQQVSGVGTLGQVLVSGGAGTLPTWATLSPATSTFVVNKYTSSTTWTKNANTQVVELIIWSGGGGGGSGRRGSNASSSGGGGGSGCYGVHIIVPQDFFAATETVTVGGTAAGGTAQTVDASNGKDGTPGNLSSFGNVVATGGDFGRGGNSSGSQTQAANSSMYTFFIVNSNTTNQGANGTTSTGNFANNIAIGLVASGGGGGGGFNTTAGLGNGGKGGDIQDLNSAHTIASGGTAGTVGGTQAGGNGNNFSQGTSSRGWLAGGTGGGGGGCTTGGVAAKGGDGGTPGGGGGGGSASANGNSSGAGGQGARGEIWVIEYS